MYSIEQVNLDWKETPRHNIESQNLHLYTDLPNDLVEYEADQLRVGESINLCGYLITRTA